MLPHWCSFHVRRSLLQVFLHIFRFVVYVLQIPGCDKGFFWEGEGGGDERCAMNFCVSIAMCIIRARARVCVRACVYVDPRSRLRKKGGERLTCQ